MNDITRLEMATNLELIEELMRRQNFVGLVLYSSQGEDDPTPLETRSDTVHRYFTMQSTMDQTLSDRMVTNAYADVVSRRGEPYRPVLDDFETDGSGFEADS